MLPAIGPSWGGCVHDREPDEAAAMDDFDATFEYALDLPAADRERLLQSLRASDPAMAEQLVQALREQLQNPDFATHTAAEVAPAVLRAVTLPVADVARAVAWYADVFGCRVIRQDALRAVVAFANLELHLVVPSLSPPALTVFAKHFAGNGTPVRNVDGARGLRVTDPWGNALEVLAEP